MRSLPASKLATLTERFTTPHNPHALNQDANEILNDSNEIITDNQLNNNNQNNKTGNLFISPNCTKLCK